MANPLSNLIFVDKPYGVSTHAPSPDIEGLTEYITRAHAGELQNRKVLVCHRLDKETSGAMIFAADADAARLMSELFESHSVQKAYLFITNRKSTQESFTARSHIAKEGSVFVSKKDLEPNSETAFQKIREDHGFTLWQASPLSGKPHQIRLHAQDHGIAILGDSAHGGSFFPQLLLHSWKIQFQHPELGAVEHTAPPSLLFARLELCARASLAQWILAAERRWRWWKLKTALPTAPHLAGEGETLAELKSSPETWAWIHTDGGDLRVAHLGEVTNLQWFAQEAPDEDERKDIKDFLSCIDATQWRLEHRLDRGRTPHTQPEWTSGELPEKWVACENGVRYEFRLKSGLSTGLFLDQRANRLWVRENSTGQRVLNLFSYTSGFSVCAALGGATQTVSVDLSASFLAWSKENFILNQLDPSLHQFRAMDSFEYLKYAARRNEKFDLVICDPPSFSRGPKGVFRLEQNLGDLLQALVQVLNPGGRILFSCNFERWSSEIFHERLKEALKAHHGTLKVSGKVSGKISATPPTDWDFELPGEEKLMKSVFIVDNGS